MLAVERRVVFVRWRYSTEVLVGCFPVVDCSTAVGRGGIQGNVGVRATIELIAAFGICWCSLRWLKRNSRAVHG